MLRSLLFVCMRVFEGQSMIKMHRTSLSVLGRFLFGECEILFSSVFPLQPFQCSWYHVFDMDPIKEAPSKALYVFWNRFLMKSNKYLQTSLEHAMNRACELPRPHASTRLCSSPLCVSMLCFAACSQPSLPLMEPPMELPSRWRVGGGIEAHLLLPLLRRHQSRVLSNHDTYFAVSYLDGSAYAKASENDCVALFSWVCHGFKNWFDSSVANPTHGH